jgi:hypothetical protein
MLWISIVGRMVAASAAVGQSGPAALEKVLPQARPIPAVQVEPLPYQQASFTVQGRELTRYHFGPSLNRPFLYPLIGPGGRSYTRMGHPHDPAGHSHHNSVWVSHQDVNGVNFWEDKGGSRILCAQVEAYEDGPRRAWMRSVNAWQDAERRTLLRERRQITVEPLDGGGWRLTIDMQLEAPGADAVTLGVTPFGPIGVRMAKSMGVLEGGGRILDSEGRLNEKDIFRKRAQWVDYSGPVTGNEAGGITLMDHPSNPNHPSAFHVRDDGWMGSCLTLDRAEAIEPGRPLRLRYGLWIHGSVPGRSEIEPQWRAFAEEPLISMEADRR